MLGGGGESSFSGLLCTLFSDESAFLLISCTEVQVAGSLWSAERQSSGRRNHIAMSIQGITDSSAAEKLVEAVLVAAAGQQMAETEQLEILCEAFEQRVPASLTMACGFRSLLKS